ncbi:MAG: cytochrome c maturation protein CcmE, partial [Pseudomonadota bacterium]
MTKRQTRMAFVGVLLIGVSVATFLALRALGENMLYFYKPSELYDGEAPLNQRVRIGGLVVEGSVKRADRGLRVEFGLTDNFRTITVAYNGILPDLFR